MTIKVDIPNEHLFEKILWLLSHFKSDGVKISTNTKKEKVYKNSKALESLEELIKMKSKNSIKIDDFWVLNPHNELSNDIS